MRPIDPYLQRLGSRILSEANDLKRTPEALAADMKVPLETVSEVIEGRAERDTAISIMRRMAETYPISLADIWVEPDDTDDGVRLMRASDSQSTARVFDRAEGTGKLSPYYEYRDTAMSRTAPFKPEWIRPIRIVRNDDADNSEVAYNKGHLMHQMTFFIGEVNFYWKLNGRSFCAALDTGDSNYITPFVPHSFTSRNAEKPGLIIAVTFAGEVRAAIDEISRIGARGIEALSADMRDSQASFKALIGRRLAAESMPVSELVSRLVDRGWPSERAASVCEGGFVPSSSEVEDLAGCLAVRPEDLLLTPLDPNEAVVVRRGSDAVPRNFPDGNNPAYRLVELARSPHQPNLKGFEISVLARSGEADGVMRNGLHEYIYNFGDHPVEIHWDGGKCADLNPGDSAYVRPMIGHAFHKPDGCGEGRLAVVRIPGRLTDGALAEFACFDGNGRARVAGEHTRWF